MIRPLLRILALAAIALPAAAQARDIAVTVRDAGGHPVQDAVVTLDAPSRSGAPGHFTINQQHTMFMPFVLVVPVGSTVDFTNLDPFRHHVYSFSPAKKFELPLYAGTPPEPIAFDTPGVVTLGCNIHDWMIAYILVVPTPWFRVTDSTGAAQLRGLPAGSYDVEVWQPRLKNSSNQPRQRVALNADVPLSFRLDLKPDFRLRRSPADSTGDSYR